MRALLTGLAVVGFAAFLIWMAMGSGGVECEVCVRSGGRSHCSTVVATDADEARIRAQSVACGVITDRMDDELACQRGPVWRAACRP